MRTPPQASFTKECPPFYPCQTISWDEAALTVHDAGGSQELGPLRYLSTLNKRILFVATSTYPGP